MNKYIYNNVSNKYEERRGGIGGGRELLLSLLESSRRLFMIPAVLNSLDSYFLAVLAFLGGIIQVLTV